MINGRLLTRCTLLRLKLIRMCGNETLWESNCVYDRTMPVFPQVSSCWHLRSGRTRSLLGPSEDSGLSRVCAQRQVRHNIGITVYVDQCVVGLNCRLKRGHNVCRMTGGTERPWLVAKHTFRDHVLKPRSQPRLWVVDSDCNNRTDDAFHIQKPTFSNK
jgi:hypothetical protein